LSFFLNDKLETEVGRYCVGGEKNFNWVKYGIAKGSIGDCAFGDNCTRAKCLLKDEERKLCFAKNGTPFWHRAKMPVVVDRAIAE